MCKIEYSKLYHAYGCKYNAEALTVERRVAGQKPCWERGIGNEQRVIIQRIKMAIYISYFLETSLRLTG